jgi:hypothetical protein
VRIDLSPLELGQPSSSMGLHDPDPAFDLVQELDELVVRHRT